MSSKETVAQWHREGKLDDQYGRLDRILTQRRFCREQIHRCFSLILTGIRPDDVDHKEPSLEAFRQKFDAFLADEPGVVETCAEFVGIQRMPEGESAKHLHRITENRLWGGDDVDVRAT